MLFDNFLVHGSLQQPGAAGGTVETGQMTAAETSVLSQQKTSILSQQCPRLLLACRLPWTKKLSKTYSF